MSIKNGVWHDAAIDPPGTGNINKSLLVIRQISSGNSLHYRYDFGIYNASVTYGGIPYEGKWNKRNVVYWMPLPEGPDKITDID
jgi:hypothetical protein